MRCLLLQNAIIPPPTTATSTALIPSCFSNPSKKKKNLTTFSLWHQFANSDQAKANIIRDIFSCEKPISITRRGGKQSKDDNNGDKKMEEAGCSCGWGQEEPKLRFYPFLCVLLQMWAGLEEAATWTVIPASANWAPNRIHSRKWSRCILFKHTWGNAFSADYRHI